MKKIFILSYLLFMAGIAHAQKSKELEEVVVKERRKIAKEREEFTRHAQSVEVIGLEEINRNNPAFIEQTLGTMAGVQIDKRTQLGGQRLVIRGYGNDQKFNSWGVKVYYNEMPITTAEGVTILDDIDFANVNNIEVIKGPAATLYGGGVGGVARFYMKSAEKKGVSLTEKFAIGSFGLLQSNTRLDIVNDSSAIALSYGHLSSDGYRPAGNSLKNFLTFFGEFKLTKKQSVTAFMSHNYSFEGVSGQISYADYYAGIDNGNLAYIRKNARNDIQTTRFALTHRYIFSSKFENSTTAFYSNQDFVRVAAGATENSMSPNFGIRSVFNFKANLTDKISNELSFGTEVQQSKSQISNYRFVGTDPANPLKVQELSKGGSYFKYSTNQSAVFFHNRTDFNTLNLSLILGLSANQINYSRVDLLSNLGLLTGYNKDLSFEKTFETSFNPHIALQKVFKEQLINLSYSEGYNAPTASTSFIGTINKSNDNLLPEKAKMFDLSIKGLLFNDKLDYQVSIFNININSKLTQLSGVNPAGGTYNYFANTGNQTNKGIEISLGYSLLSTPKSFITKIEPFLNYSNYNFKYNDFKTKFGSEILDYSNKQVVGLPKTKYTIGVDIITKLGMYFNSTYNVISDVYTDFANTNNVKGFALLNSKIGYKITGKKMDFDVYFAGNNLTNQINYTFLFLGNNINDSDPGNNYPVGVATDVNPGPNKAYYFGGVNVKFRF